MSRPPVQHDFEAFLSSCLFDAPLRAKYGEWADATAGEKSSKLRELKDRMRDVAGRVELTYPSELIAYIDGLDDTALEKLASGLADMAQAANDPDLVGIRS